MPCGLRLAGRPPRPTPEPRALRRHLEERLRRCARAARAPFAAVADGDDDAIGLDGAADPDLAGPASERWRYQEVAQHPCAGPDRDRSGGSPGSRPLATALSCTGTCDSGREHDFTRCVPGTASFDDHLAQATWTLKPSTPRSPAGRVPTDPGPGWPGGLCRRALRRSRRDRSRQSAGGAAYPARRGRAARRTQLVRGVRDESASGGDQAGQAVDHQV